MYRPWIVPVGGFLGAGKTTLILAAARVLKERGMKSAALLNDQGADLVDTAYMESSGVAADEVAGACFCCRFSELISAANRLRALTPDVIFIEPVGSCTDLAATLLRPLQQEFFDEYRVAPLTVVVDPDLAKKVEAGLADENVRYLFEHQIAEADIVAFSKCDLYPEVTGFSARRLSALTGAGLEAWLDETLSGQIASGTKSLEIDYKQYAAAEAALAWLNWSATLQSMPAMSAPRIVGPLMDELNSALTNAGGTVAHLKVLTQTAGSYLKASLVNNSDEPVVEGDLAASPARSHRIRVNVRAVLAATTLERIFRQTLDRLSLWIKPAALVWSEEHFQCFSPSTPVPERRLV